jgi:hypothetical protein
MTPMHALLLTILSLPGADASLATSPGYAQPAMYTNECEDCQAGGRHGHHGHHGHWHDPLHCGPMPQTCYNPSFGCYASTRFMHRYPAFHGNYYRTAYNYRSYFDYPWHAGLHEPTSHFSYHVPGEIPTQEIPAPLPAANQPPAPIITRSVSVLKAIPAETEINR